MFKKCFIIAGINMINIENGFVIIKKSYSRSPQHGRNSVLLTVHRHENLPNLYKILFEEFKY